MFGLADLGYPELGSFSLLDMTSVRLPFGMGIERDILFATDLSISAWAKAAAGPEAFAMPNASLPRRPVWPGWRVRSQLEIRKAADAQRVSAPLCPSDPRAAQSSE